jgi:hypothetical protein
MKVVVQNGGNHALSRKLVEAALAKVAPNSLRPVSTVVILARQSKQPEAQFHSVSSALDITGPQDATHVPDFIRWIIIAALIARDFGHVPARISASALSTYEDEATRIMSE